MTVAMDAMAVAIHIKYALGLNRHLTFYWNGTEGRMGWEGREAEGSGRKGRERRGNKHTRFKTCGAAHACAPLTQNPGDATDHGHSSIVS